MRRPIIFPLFVSIFILLFFFGFACASQCPQGYFTPDGVHCVVCRSCASGGSVIRACAGAQDTLCGSGVQVALEVQGLTRINTTLWWTLFGNISAWRQEEQVNATVAKIPCPSALQYRNDSGVCNQCTQCGARAVEVSTCTVGGDRICQGYISGELEVAGVTGIASNNLSLLGYNNASWSAADASQYLVEKMPCWPGYYRGDDGACYACTACRPWEVQVSPCRTQVGNTECVPDLKVMLGIVDGPTWRDREALLAMLSKLLNISNSSIEFEDASTLEVTTPLQALVKIYGIEQADARLILAALNRSGILTKTVEVTQDDEITIEAIPCPAGQYRADLDSLCTDCQICTNERVEVRPCTTQADRMCGQSLNVGFKVDNIAAWQVNQNVLVQEIGQILLGNGTVIPEFEYELREEVDMDVQIRPCIPGVEYTGKDRICHACTVCKAFETEIRPCGDTQDRVCRGQIQVDLSILGAAGINTSRWDLSQVQADLAVALGYSDALLNMYNLQYSRPDVSIQVALMPCPAGTFVNISIPACQECTICTQDFFYASPTCGGVQDAVCRPCTRCGPWDTLVEACGADHDSVCRGAVDSGVRVGNATALDTDMLQSLLSQAVHAAPGVDSAYIDRWFSANNMLQVFSPYEIEIQALNCSLGYYQDNATATCRQCSLCANGAYVVQACAWDADTICQTCDTCQLGEYEACACAAVSDACPTGNRICYAYPVHAWEIEVLWLSPYDAACLSAAYVPRFLASIQAQLLMQGGVAIQGYEIELQPGSIQTLADGTTQGLGVRVSPLFPNCTVAQGGFYLHNLTLLLPGVFAQQPNADQTFDAVLERALQDADSAQVSQANAGRRRLLQASQANQVNCPEDTYLFDYGGGLSLLCIPCLDDPVPSATASTPPALRWTVTRYACPSGLARTCFGGATQPICVIRNGAAALLRSRAALTSITCPTQQLLVLDPITLLALCVGRPCSPGTTGQPGKCTVCAQGTYKDTTGSAGCTDCPADTYNPEPQAYSADACVACPQNQSSTAGSAFCLCDPGFGSEACNACLPGDYKPYPGPWNCSSCPPGSYSQAYAETACDACAEGTFAGTDGMPACEQCDAGSYQNHPGGSSCTVCGPGFLSTEDRLACRPCPAGTYESSRVCLPCGPFQISTPGQSACGLCPSGTGFTQEGTCSPCPHGQSHNSTGLCAPCPENTFYLAPAGCLPCPLRTHNPDPEHQSTCSPCPPGTSGDTCTACAPGTYSTGYSLSACTACEGGKYTQSPGAVSSSACVNCVAGTYWLDHACLACPEHTESPPAAVSVTECLAIEGSYALPGQPGTLCPPNTFCVRGAMQPSPCPSGSTSSPGSRACVHEAQYNQARLMLWDWIVPPVWGATVLLGIGCVLRNRSLLRRKMPVLPVKLRQARYR